MLGAKEMRKRDRGKELKLVEERKKRACFDLDIGPVNLITQPTDNSDTEKMETNHSTPSCAKLLLLL